MFPFPEARFLGKASLLVLITLGAGGCGDSQYKALNLNPHTKPPKTAKKQRTVPCDTTITANTDTGGVDLDAAFVCENDTVTWQIKNRHTFKIEFKGNSPFQNGKSKFTDQDPSGIVKDHYDKLEVYKYSITVDSKPTVDPQVVGGGNP
jgi:hypothetical protein